MLSIRRCINISWLENKSTHATNSINKFGAQGWFQILGTLGFHFLFFLKVFFFKTAQPINLVKTFKTFEIPLEFLQRELWVKFRGKFSVPNSQPAKSHDTLIVSPPVGRSLRTKGKLRQFSGSKLNGPSNESVFAHYCFHKKKSINLCA